MEDTNFEVDAEIKAWSCKRCTLENPAELSICQACGGSRLKSLEKSHKSANNATSHHPTTNSTTLSGVARLKTQNGHETSHWTCPKCTLRNPMSALKCRVCENSRKLPPIHKTSSNLAKCTTCTFDNPADQKKCEMCNASLKIHTSNTPPQPQIFEGTNKILPKILPSTIMESRPGSTTSMGSRHESELMEQLRKVEESAAKDRWRNIVQFCKEVRFF